VPAGIEVIGEAGAGQTLQGAGLDRERAGLVHPVQATVDEAGPDAEGGQLSSEGQPSRPGADHEHVDQPAGHDATLDALRCKGHCQVGVSPRKDWTPLGSGAEVFPAWTARTVCRLRCVVWGPGPATIIAVPAAFVQSTHCGASPETCRWPRTRTGLPVWTEISVIVRSLVGRAAWSALGAMFRLKY